MLRLLLLGGINYFSTGNPLNLSVTLRHRLNALNSICLWEHNYVNKSKQLSRKRWMFPSVALIFFPHPAQISIIDVKVGIGVTYWWLHMKRSYFRMVFSIITADGMLFSCVQLVCCRLWPCWSVLRCTRWNGCSICARCACARTSRACPVESWRRQASTWCDFSAEQRSVQLKCVRKQTSALT